MLPAHPFKHPSYYNLERRFPPFFQPLIWFHEMSFLTTCHVCCTTGAPEADRYAGLPEEVCGRRRQQGQPQAGQAAHREVEDREQRTEEEG